MSDPVCSACHYFTSADEKGGICRRYPPQVLIVPGQLVGQFQPANLFPAVSKNHWCGEYAAARGVEALLADVRLADEVAGEA